MRTENYKAEYYWSDFAKNLRDAMYMKLKTPKDIADAVGITRQTISYYMNGQRVPDVYTAKGIALFLGVSMDFLMGMEAKNE